MIEPPFTLFVKQIEVGFRYAVKRRINAFEYLAKVCYFALCLTI